MLQHLYMYCTCTYSYVCYYDTQVAASIEGSKADPISISIIIIINHNQAPTWLLVFSSVFQLRT